MAQWLGGLKWHLNESGINLINSIKYIARYLKVQWLRGLKLRLKEVRNQLANFCPVLVLIKSAVVEWSQTAS